MLHLSSHIFFTESGRAVHLEQPHLPSSNCPACVHVSLRWHKGQDPPPPPLLPPGIFYARCLSASLQGVDAAFDEAEQGVAEVDELLEEYLEQVRSRMKCKRGIVFVSLNKDSHVLELPEVGSGLSVQGLGV